MIVGFLIFFGITFGLKTDYVVPLGVEFEVLLDSEGFQWRSTNANAWFFRGNDA